MLDRKALKDYFVAKDIYKNMNTDEMSVREKRVLAETEKIALDGMKLDTYYGIKMDFLEKKIDLEYLYDFGKLETPEVEKETEKAQLMTFGTGKDGEKVQAWIPKSLVKVEA